MLEITLTYYGPEPGGLLGGDLAEFATEQIDELLRRHTPMRLPWQVTDIHISSSRPGPRRPRRDKRPPRTQASRDHTAEIRAWAKSTGRIVLDRGRLPSGIIEDYETAHRSSHDHASD